MFLADGTLSAQMAGGSSFSLIFAEETFKVFHRRNFQDNLSFFFFYKNYLGSKKNLFIVVQSLIHVQLVVTPWTAAHQASLSFTISQSLLKLMSIELVMPSNPLIICYPLLLPLISPNKRVFSNESALRIRLPKYYSFNSASVFPKSIQDWFPLGLPGLISLSKGLSRVFSSTTIQKHKFFSTQLSLWSNSRIPT